MKTRAQRVRNQWGFPARVPATAKYPPPDHEPPPAGAVRPIPTRSLVTTIADPPHPLARLLREFRRGDDRLSRFLYPVPRLLMPLARVQRGARRFVETERLAAAARVRQRSAVSLDPCAPHRRKAPMASVRRWRRLPLRDLVLARHMIDSRTLTARHSVALLAARWLQTARRYRASMWASYRRRLSIRA